MNMETRICKGALILALLAASNLAWALPPRWPLEGNDPAQQTGAKGLDLSEDSDAKQKDLQIEAVDTDKSGAKTKRKVGWLGVATEETSEALASQLGLNRGEGLTIVYVGADSPAAKAGLQKNDVLVEFDGQLLVHPSQFRKLIQSHNEGDTVKLGFYRSGKKQSVTATVGKASSGFVLRGDEGAWQGDLRELNRQLRELPLGDQIRQLHESLSKGDIEREVRLSMEEVRKALHEALRHATNAQRTFGPAAREFRELARRGLDVDKDATVVVKSKRNSVQTIVTTDDTGTYVVVATPKKQLTAHDKSGKLLFDGPIDTAREQDKVPKQVWDKVKPMLEQLKPDQAATPKPEEEEKGEN